MDMSSFNMLMDLIVVAAGGYMLYAWFSMKRSGKIIGGMLMPKDLNLSKCKDTQGFLRELLPKFLITGIIVFASGVIMVIGDVVMKLPSPVYTVAYVAAFCALILYAWYMKKLIGKYWPVKR